MTLSGVEVKSVLKYPRKDSVTVYQQDSFVCDSDSKCEEESLIDVEDLKEVEQKQSFPVGELQSFDYYHQLIAEDLRIIEVMEKVGRFMYEFLFECIEAIYGPGFIKYLLWKAKKKNISNMKKKGPEMWYDC